MKDVKRGYNRNMFLIPMVLVTVVLLIMARFVSSYLEVYTYGQLERNALQMAKGYSNSLSLASKASQVMDSFLEEKILGAARFVGDHEGELSQEVLESIAEAFRVEEIYVYDAEGRVVLSNTGDYLGWQAEADHPVDRFLRGDAQTLVEEVRPSTSTGINYLYGYYRLPEDGVVQVAIAAERIEGFLLSFQSKKLIDQIVQDGDIRGASFLDMNHVVLESSFPERIGQLVVSQKIFEALETGGDRALIETIDGKKVQVALAPVLLDGERYGTLIITQWTDDADRYLGRVKIFGLLTLIAFWGSFILALLSVDKKNKRLTKLAYFDELTGLPNKTNLMETLSEELEKKTALKGGIILLNLMNFKEINIRYGYEEGDRILKTMGEKLKRILSKDDRCFRFTGERFIYWSQERQDREALEVLALEINREFTESFQTLELDEPLYLRMGILVFSPKYRSVDAILKDVSLALNSVSTDDSRNYSIFDDVLEKRSQRVMLIEKALRKVIDHPEVEDLYLVYQPQYDYRLERVIAMEALARITIPEIGLVPPMEFIEIAEKKRLIVPLGDLILAKACRFINRLDREGFHGIRVAVNISPIQLIQGDFVEKVVSVLEDHQVPPSSLILEITESVLIHRYETINDSFKILEAMGVMISLDDFGKGYSSLDRLRGMNIHQIKIDKNFISNLREDISEEFVTADIINIAHKFGLEVVGEGIETLMQWEYLEHHHCDIAQGYYLSRPLEEEKVLAFIG